MKVEILKDYIDYCNRNNKLPELQELLQWKKKYSINLNIKMAGW